MNNKLSKILTVLLAVGIATAGILAPFSFAGAAGVPFVTTDPATNISQTSVVLNASVNPNEGSTTAWFEYGTSLALGLTAGSQNIGNGSSSVAVTANLTGLTVGTTYYFRAAASNNYGGPIYGAILSFTTPTTIPQAQGAAPIVSTLSVSSITQTSATINGYINPNNSATTAWFEYGTASTSITSVAGNQPAGTYFPITVSGFLINLQPNIIYYYRVVASNPYGTNYGNTLNFITQASPQAPQTSTTSSSLTVVPTPTIYTLSATSVNNTSAVLNASVNPNNSNTNLWFEYGTTQSLGYMTGNQSAGSGNMTVNLTSYVSNLTPNTAYYYRAAASNPYGTSYGSILSFVTLSTIQTSGNAPSVYASPASYTSQNTTLLNGSVNPNNSATNIWFQWGKTASFGNVTNSQSMGSGNSSIAFSSALSGLEANTVYYFRAAGQNSYGTSYSDTLSFTTGGIQVATPSVTPSSYTITPQPQIIYRTTAEKLEADLTPALNKTEAAPEEEITYSLTYRNNSDSAITDAVLKVVLPSEVKYLIAAPLTSSQEKNILNFILGEIKGKNQGVITISAKVNNDVKDKNVLIFGATLTYNDKNKTLQSIDSYITATVAYKGGGLTASLIDAFKNILSSAWLYIILILLCAGFTIWYLRRKSALVIKPEESKLLG